MPEQELYHFGVKGMKWGVRKGRKKKGPNYKMYKGEKLYDRNNKKDTNWSTRGRYSKKLSAKADRKFNSGKKLSAAEAEAFMRDGQRWADKALLAISTGILAGTAAHVVVSKAVGW